MRCCETRQSSYWPKPTIHETGGRIQLPRGATPEGGSRRRRGFCSTRSTHDRLRFQPSRAAPSLPHQVPNEHAENAGTRKASRHPKSLSSLDPLENDIRRHRTNTASRVRKKKRSSAERAECSTTGCCLAAGFLNIDWDPNSRTPIHNGLGCPRLAVGLFAAARNMTLSPRDLIELPQGLDMVVHVRDAVHGVQHHHVRAQPTPAVRCGRPGL